MKTHRGSRGVATLHTFSTSALDGGEWSISHPGQFTLPPFPTIKLLLIVHQPRVASQPV